MFTKKTPENTFNWSGGEKTKLTAHAALKESVRYMPYTQYVVPIDVIF